MSRILGIDLGANSLGWAVINNETKQIERSGVRTFPAGVNDFDTSKEQSKNVVRRMARGIRRQIFRKKMRKQHLLKLLINYNMVPLSLFSLQEWIKKDVYPKDIFFQDWIMQNPYQLRAKALTEELTRLELGRVFYHMIQRRGFLSNRKTQGEEDGKIFAGVPADGKVGISETRELLASHKTLGAYLNSLDPHKVRLRNRYTERQMYIDEFEQIWDVQSTFHTDLTHELRERIGGRARDERYKMDGVLFHQRPLRSQRHTIGKCTFEPAKPRYLKDSLLYEEFRAAQTANHIEINGELLDPEERLKVVDFLLSKEKPKFKEIRKLLKKNGPGYHSQWQDDDVLPGSKVISALRKIFGDRWNTFTEKEKEDIWHVIYSSDDNSWLHQYAAEKWYLNDEEIKKVLRIRIEPAYGSLSRKAISSILYFLRLGFKYNESVVLAGVRNGMGHHEWDNHPDADALIDTILSFSFRSGHGTIKEQLEVFCKDHLAFSDSQLKKLYHHSMVKDHIEIRDILGEPPLVRNPIVMTSLYELRRVVNELIKEFGRFDEIHIELARDLKKTADERGRIRSDNTKREKYHIQIDDELREYNIRVNHENRLRLKLFKELKQKCCPYTGRPIQIGYSEGGLNLFSGRVQIEHIIPWQRSLNGSYNNLTLCDADLNRAKGKSTPLEFFSDQGETAWNFAKNRARDILPYNKFQTFCKKEIDDDFTSRQLNDTRYASRLAKEFLSQVCEKIHVFPGGATAELRHHWGLNSILSEDNTKVRLDHRHHAVDAIAIAALGSNHLQQLARWNRYQREYEMQPVAEPWEGFRDQAEASVDQILVSYRKVDRVISRRKGKIKKDGKWVYSNGLAARGFLHMDTIYGKRIPPEKGESRYVVRKPLESITSSTHVDKIVDAGIRNIIKQRLRDLGIDVHSKKYDVPKGAFFQTFEDGSKEPLVFISHKNGGRTPIKKVRIEENLGKAVPVNREQNQWVNPRNNHHVALYRQADGQLKEQVVTFWDAVQRKMMGLDVFQKELEDGSVLETTMQINDLFLIGLSPDVVLETIQPEILRKHLYRVQKLSTSYYVFRLNSESTIQSIESHHFYRFQSLGAWEKQNPMKIRLSATGLITMTI